MNTLCGTKIEAKQIVFVGWRDYQHSPAGVGMSCSLNKSDYTAGDLNTAADTHKFLLKVLCFIGVTSNRGLQCLFRGI
jgi:hypothetical protein